MPRGKKNTTTGAPAPNKLAPLHALAAMLAMVLEEENRESGGFQPLCIAQLHELLFETFIPKTAGFSDTAHLQLAEVERCVENVLAGGPTHSTEPREPASSLSRRLIAAMFDLGSTKVSNLAPEYFKKQAAKKHAKAYGPKPKASPASSSKPKAKGTAKPKASATGKQLGLDVTAKPKRKRASKANGLSSSGITEATNPGAA